MTKGVTAYLIRWGENILRNSMGVMGHPHLTLPPAVRCIKFGYSALATINFLFFVLSFDAATGLRRNNVALHKSKQHDDGGNGNN